MFPQEVDAVPSPVFSPILRARPRRLLVSHHLETFHPVTLSPLLLAPSAFGCRQPIFLPDICVKGFKVTRKNNDGGQRR